MARRGDHYVASSSSGDYHRRDDRRAQHSPRRDRFQPTKPQNSTRNMYQFQGTDQYRPPPRGDNYRPQSNGRESPSNKQSYHHDFSFRAGHSEGPRFPPAQSPRELPDRHERAQRNRYNGPQRGRGWKFNPPFDRPLLRTRREVTPEQLTGMHDGQARFMAADDLSDSEGEAMPMESDAEGDKPESTTSPDGQAELNGDVPQVKRLRTGPAVDDDAVPKWSNPDPYTSLPPPGDSQAKKKDVVKLIRKAKVAASKGDPATTGADTSDFISFNFDDEEPASPSDLEDEAVEPHVPVTIDSVNGTHALLADQLDASDNLALPASAAFPVASRSSTVSTQVANGVMNDQWPPPQPIKAGTKRRFDDVLGPLPAPQRSSSKRGKKNRFDGSLLLEWVAKSPETATPWCSVDHSSTENMGYWLHKEICDFYEYVKPRDYEDNIRRGLLSRVKQFVDRHYPQYEVHCFGSFAAGLYLPTADMDLVIMSPQFVAGLPPISLTHFWIRNLAKYLEKDGIAQPDSTETVLGAKVPIVKFVDNVTGLRCDISFENATGVVANGTFALWKQQFPAMPVIVTLIKQLLLMRGLNEVFTGGLGGFSITCLVTSMMQLHPGLQSSNMNQLHNLGELLLIFLDLYGNNLNTTTTGIQLNPPGYFDKNFQNRVRYNPGNIDRLSIIDPNRSDNDISSGTSNHKTILQCFSRAYAMLQARMGYLQYSNIAGRKGSSILGCLLGGNYSSFEWQRDRLRRLHEQSVAMPRSLSYQHQNQEEYALSQNHQSSEMASNEQKISGRQAPPSPDMVMTEPMEHGTREDNILHSEGYCKKDNAGPANIGIENHPEGTDMPAALYISGVNSDKAACSCIATADLVHVQRLEYMGTFYLVHFNSCIAMYTALEHALDRAKGHHHLPPSVLVINAHQASAGLSLSPIRVYDTCGFLKIARTKAGRAVISEEDLTARPRLNQLRNATPPVDETELEWLTKMPAHVRNELSAAAEVEAQKTRAAVFKQQFPQFKNLPDLMTESEERTLRSNRARADTFKKKYPQFSRIHDVPNLLDPYDYQRWKGMAEPAVPAAENLATKLEQPQEMSKHAHYELPQSDTEIAKARPDSFRQHSVDIKDVPALPTESQERDLKGQYSRARSLKGLYPQLAEIQNLPDSLTRIDFKRWKQRAEDLAKASTTSGSTVMNGATSNNKASQPSSTMFAGGPPTHSPELQRYNLRSIITIPEILPAPQTGTSLEGTQRNQQNLVQRRYNLRSSRDEAKLQWATQEFERTESAKSRKPRKSQAAGTSVDNPMVLD